MNKPSKPHVSCNLNSFKGGVIGEYLGDCYRAFEGGTMSLYYNSCRIQTDGICEEVCCTCLGSNLIHALHQYLTWAVLTKAPVAIVVT